MNEIRFNFYLGSYAVILLISSHSPPKTQVIVFLFRQFVTQLNNLKQNLSINSFRIQFISLCDGGALWYMFSNRVLTQQRTKEKIKGNQKQIKRKNIFMFLLSVFCVSKCLFLQTDIKHISSKYFRLSVYLPVCLYYWVSFFCRHVFISSNVLCFFFCCFSRWFLNLSLYSCHPSKIHFFSVTWLCSYNFYFLFVFSWMSVLSWVCLKFQNVYVLSLSLRKKYHKKCQDKGTFF